MPPNANRRKKRDEYETSSLRAFKRSWPTKSGLTEAKVRAECKKVLEGSKTGKACKAIGVNLNPFQESCVLDVQVQNFLKSIFNLIPNKRL